MTDELRWYLLTKKRTEALIGTAVRKLREEDIEPVLIKGWAAASNYPDGTPRFLGDIDLAVAAEDFDRAQKMVEDTNAGIIGVDLHRELRHLDTLDWPTLIANSKLVNIGNEDVRVLSPEDHLRVICVHWLTDGGEWKDKLWDVYYAVQNRPADFDWAKCLDVVKMNRRGWVIKTIGLAHRYLGLYIDDLAFAHEAKQLPTWLTRCVERAWERDVPMQPLEDVLTNTSALARQVRKRIPPNPIQATVFCEGVFDDRGRIPYQIRDFFGRLRPAFGRAIRSIRKRLGGW